MSKRLVLVPALAALLLAGCSPSTTPENKAAVPGQPANADDVDASEVGNEQEAGNVAATVAAMSDRQRNVVFIRAILDAGLPCQTVKSSTRLPDQDGIPLWRADCAGGGSHMISITPDGTANIVSRSDR